MEKLGLPGKRHNKVGPLTKEEWVNQRKRKGKHSRKKDKKRPHQEAGRKQ